MRPEQIAKDGLCEFDCKYCKINDWCNNYNHKDNEVNLDQSENRKQFATEYLERQERFKNVNSYMGEIIA